MADPLSVAASIVTVLQLAQSVVQGIQVVKDSSKERKTVRDEVIYLSGLLFNLKGGLERHQLNQELLSSLDTPLGPLAQLKDAVEQLSALLIPSTGLRNVGKTLFWAHQKDKVNDLLRKIERQKTFILFALENNQLDLSHNIRRDIQNLKDGMGNIQKAVSQLDIHLQERLDTALEIRDSQLQTPLSAAASAGQRSVVEILLQHSCRVDGSATSDSIADAVGATYPHSWVRDENLYHEFNGYTAPREKHALRIAAWEGEGEGPANVVIKRAERLTPLHDAAWYGYLAVVKLLVEHGATIDQRDALGRTPLLLATTMAAYGVVMFLTQHGADASLALWGSSCAAFTRGWRRPK